MIDNKPYEQRKYSIRTIFLILGIIFLCLAGIFFSRISLIMARSQARRMILQIPMPLGMQKIDVYTVGKFNNNSCYKGQAYLLAGTNLNGDEVKNFYEDHFIAGDWNIQNELGSPSDPYFRALSTEKSSAGASMGVRIRSCDKNCRAAYFSESTITNALKKYKNFYIIETFFVPYEVRGNVCWCCEGG